jgi:hypothetical protein
MEEGYLISNNNSRHHSILPLKLCTITSPTMEAATIATAATVLIIVAVDTLLLH